MKMREYETIYGFNVLLHDIANNSFPLGKKMSEEKIVRKILRSFSKRFNMKVTAIKEAQDVSTMKIYELIESLLKFEMVIDDKFEKKARVWHSKWILEIVMTS